MVCCRKRTTRRHSSGESSHVLQGFERPIEPEPPLDVSDTDSEDEVFLDQLAKYVMQAREEENESSESDIEPPEGIYSDSDIDREQGTSPRAPVPVFSSSTSSSSTSSSASTSAATPPLSPSTPYYISPELAAEIELKRQSALLKKRSYQIAENKRAAEATKEARKTAPKQLQATTTQVPFPLADSALPQVTASSVAHTKQKKKRKRSKLMPGILARQRRGLTTLLANVQFAGNNRLRKVQMLKAILIAKDGHLSKQGVQRWFHGFGTGPSYAHTKLVYPLLAEHGAAELVRDLEGRAAAGVTHANLPAPWRVPTHQHAHINVHTSICTHQHAHINTHTATCTH